MNRRKELQTTISRLVGRAYDLGAQAAREGRDRHTLNPYEPTNPMLAQVYRLGHMDEVATMHFAQVQDARNAA
jgi:hypothetical protein